MEKTLANSINILIKRKGLNIAELANILGLPKATLHKIVKGKSTRPRFKALSLIANYFNISVSQLLEGKIDDHIHQENIKNIPIIDWDNIFDWLNEKPMKKNFTQTTPVNLDVSAKSFALIFHDTNSFLFKANSVLLFDPTLEVKDGTYVLVQLSDYPNALLRQIICDASNIKYLKSLNPEFSTNIKKLEPSDKIIAILVMAKTLFYHP